MAICWRASDAKSASLYSAPCVRALRTQMSKSPTSQDTHLAASETIGLCMCPVQCPPWADRRRFHSQELRCAIRRMGRMDGRVEALCSSSKKGLAKNEKPDARFE